MGGEGGEVKAPRGDEYGVARFRSGGGGCGDVCGEGGGERGEGDRRQVGGALP